MSCGSCGKTYYGPSRASTLKRHIKTVHCGYTEGVCSFCQRQFTRMNSKKRHELTCSMRKQINSQHFVKPPPNFPFSKLLFSLLFIYFSDQSDTCCEWCGKFFTGKSRKYTLMRHIRTAHSPCYYEASCAFCKRQFTRTSSKNKHEIKCRLRYDDVNSQFLPPLHPFILTVSAVSKISPPPSVSCKVCGKVFFGKNRNHLVTRHYKGVHCNIRPHICNLCGKTYQQSNNLKKHKTTCGAIRKL